MDIHYSVVLTYHSIYNHSPVFGYLGHFYCLYTNNNSVTISVHTTWRAFVNVAVGETSKVECHSLKKIKLKIQALLIIELLKQF